MKKRWLVAIVVLKLLTSVSFSAHAEDYCEDECGGDGDVGLGCGAAEEEKCLNDCHRERGNVSGTF